MMPDYFKADLWAWWVKFGIEINILCNKVDKQTVQLAYRSPFKILKF